MRDNQDQDQRDRDRDQDQDRDQQDRDQDRDRAVSTIDAVRPRALEPAPAAEWITAEEAARLLSTTRRTVCRYVERGALTGRKIAGKRGDELRVDLSSVMTFRLLRGTEAVSQDRDRDQDRDQDERDNRDRSRDRDNRDSPGADPPGAEWERWRAEYERSRAADADEILFLRRQLEQSREAEAQLRTLLLQSEKTVAALAEQVRAATALPPADKPRRRWWEFWR